mgnify:FL=1
MMGVVLMDEDLIKVGEYKDIFNIILGIDIKEKEIYRSKGLPTHIVKRKHYKVMKYIDYIPDIIANPDYIGINPNEKESIELIKKYKDNVLLGIKVDKQKDILYVSTMHDVQVGKIERRLYSGRLKLFDVDKGEKE